MKKTARKLTLHKDTIQRLSDPALQAAVGGEKTDSGGVVLVKSDLDSLCGCPTQP